MNLAIGIDLGGTNIKAALVDTQSAKTLATLSKPTRDGEFEGNTPRFALTVREIVHEFEAQAGSKTRRRPLRARFGESKRQCIDWMPGRMHGLEKFDWSAFLERDCRVLNDAHAALLGEVWAGAAKTLPRCLHAHPRHRRRRSDLDGRTPPHRQNRPRRPSRPSQHRLECATR
jgi:glucokinase